MSILQDLTKIGSNVSIKKLQWLGIVLLAGFLLRGSLFRLMVSYKLERTYSVAYKIEDAHIKDFIIKHPEIVDREIEDIKHIALIAERITDDLLVFSKESTTINPNLSFREHAAGDAGFSAFYSAVCNYLIDMYGLKDYYICFHTIGPCFYIKTNLSAMVSPYGGRPFPSEFHFNIIKNRKTGELLALDPSVFVKYRITTVSLEK